MTAATARRLSEPSPAELLATLPEAEREQVVRSLGEAKVRELRRDWPFWARPDQVLPDPDDPIMEGVRAFLLQGGRGSGKTRSGAEAVCDRAKVFADHDAEHLIGLGNRTFGEVTALQIEGVSGLKRVCRRRGWEFDHATTSRTAKLTIPRPGRRPHVSRVELHTSREPDLARGRNFHTFWGDEFASWYPIVDELGGTMFTNVDLGLRAVGPVPPLWVLTFTPRNVPWLRALLGPMLPPPYTARHVGEGEYGRYLLNRATLFDNLVNLAAEFVRLIIDRYAHSPLGAQEIYGELVDRVEGALWTPEKINAAGARLAPTSAAELGIYRVAVGVDPSGGRAEAGIVVAGVGRGTDGKPHLYVLEDATAPGDADVWPGEAIAAARRHAAEVVAAEKNFGGDMVRVVIKNQDGTVRVKLVNSSRGKQLRAEPVANLWAPNQRRGHIVGHMPLLEVEMTTWRPGEDSPNRLDGMVFAAAELMPELALPGVEAAAYGSQVAAARL